MPKHYHKLNLFIVLVISAFFAGNVRSLNIKLSRTVTTTPGVTSKSFLAAYTNITLTNYYNVQYSGTIYIGSNNQSFNLIFDTGSPWLWVPEANTDNIGFQSTFNCNASKTCSNCADTFLNQSEINGCGNETSATETYTLVYSSGIVQGYLVSDFVSFDADTPFRQNFLVCEDATILQESFVDGIFGMSLKTGNNGSSNMPTILTMLQANGIITNQIFSLYINNNPEAYGDDSSLLMLGGYDTNYASGPFVNINVHQDSMYWQAALNGFSLQFNDTLVSIPLMSKSAIFDSGTSHIVMYGQDFISITSQIRKSVQCAFELGKYTCQCPGGSLAGFPNLMFEIDSRNFTIPPSLYLSIEENACNFLIDGSLRFNSTTTPYIVLGDVFLRNYYSVFNAENYTISFAPAAIMKENFVTTLELFYLILGVFILVMFGIFLICLVKTWTIKRKSYPKASLGTSGMPMADRNLNNTGYYSQLLNDN